MRTRLLLTVAGTTLLAGCAAPASPTPTGTTDIPPVTATPTGEPEPVAPAEPEPQPATPSPTSAPPALVTSRFIGDVEWPPLPAVPPLPAADATTGGWLQGGAGWELRYDIPADHVECTVYGPDGSLHTTVSWAYAARTHPIEADPDDELEMTVELVRVPWPDGPGTSFEVTWKEPGELRARASAGTGTPPPDTKRQYGQVQVSDDRRSIAFAFVTVTERGYEVERTTWMTVAGTITCPEPMPDLTLDPT